MKGGPVAIGYVVSGWVLSGCLDPQAADEPPLPGLILPAGSQVRSAHDDAAIDRQIDQNDGVGAEVPLLHGFAGGGAIGYWDFGPAPGFAAPLFLLVREGRDGLEPIDHPAVIDGIPGESGYSPFRAVLAVEVTERYDGELLTSFAAVQEARQLGIVAPPVLQAEAFDRPVVARGVNLVGGGDGPPRATLYWKGLAVDAYDFGSFALAPPAEVPARPRYVLRREGGEPLSEVARGVDITGDGDRNDTNDVLGAVAGQPDYSPLCETVAVALASATDAIDTFADETMSSIRAATDLFDPEPVAGTVVAYERTGDLRNCPQAGPGGT